MLTFTLTNAGRTALVNAQANGTTAKTISQIGVSEQHTAGSLEALTGLPGEIKRLATFAGIVTSEHQLHVSIRDESADTYSLRAFGLYFDDGVLFGVYSQPDPIMEKSAAAMMLLAADLALATLTTAQITFGDTNFVNPGATTQMPGVVELATASEVATGDDHTRAVTPWGLKQLLTAIIATLAPVSHSHAMGDVTGLGAALAGKSNTDHTHAAGDIVSGVLAVARIPDLAISKITGLATALAAKAEAVHTHAASDIISGVLAVARIPDLAMSKITGLVDALAGKANAAHTHALTDLPAQLWQTGSTGTSDWNADGATQAGQGRLTLGNADNGPTPGVGSYFHPVNYQYMGTPNRTQLAFPYIVSPNAGGGIYYRTHFNGAWAAWAQVWTSITFNPASKLDTSSFTWAALPGKPTSFTPVAHTHEILDVTGLGSALDARLLLSGGSMSGRLVLAGTNPGGAAPFNLPNSGTTNPTTTADGDIWHRSNQLWCRLGGSAQLLVTSSSYSLVSQAEAAAGEATAIRWWSAERVRHAIAAWAAPATHSHAMSDVTGLAAALGGKADASHAHDAADIISGVLSVARIPDLLMSKISGLVDALAGASAAQFRSNSGTQPLQASSVWEAAELVTLTQAATLTVDLSAGLNFTTTMTGNRTLAAPTNAKPGQSGIIQLVQDGTGSRTLTFDNAWKFMAGVKPTLSTAAGARDVLAFTVIAPGTVVASLMKDVK